MPPARNLTSQNHDHNLNRLNLKSLQRQPMKRPTLPAEFKKKISAGVSYKRDTKDESFDKLLSEDDIAVSSKYPDSGIKGDFVMTQTSYEQRGAKLMTSQLRAPVANRTDGTRVYCNNYTRYHVSLIQTPLRCVVSHRCR